MKLDRRTVLAGTAAAFAAPLLAALPARADAKRQSLVDSCLEIRAQGLGRQGLSRRRQAHDQCPRRADHPRAGAGRLHPGRRRRARRADGAHRSQRLEPARLLRHGLGQPRPADRRQGARRSCSSSAPRRACNAILDHKFKFGAEAGVTLVAVGIGMEGASTSAAAPTSSPSRTRRACSPAPRSKAPTSTPTTTGTRSITARAPPPRRSCSTGATPIPAPSRSGSTSPSGENANRPQSWPWCVMDVCSGPWAAAS